MPGKLKWWSSFNSYCPVCCSGMIRCNKSLSVIKHGPSTELPSGLNASLHNIWNKFSESEKNTSWLQLQFKPLSVIKNSLRSQRSVWAVFPVGLEKVEQLYHDWNQCVYADLSVHIIEISERYMNFSGKHHHLQIPFYIPAAWFKHDS